MASAFLHGNGEEKSSLTRGRRIGRVILTAFAVIAAVILAAVLCVLFIFRRELGSVWSLQKQDDFYYTMDYKTDYGLDEFLESGARTDSELAGFVVKKLMKGIWDAPHSQRKHRRVKSFLAATLTISRQLMRSCIPTRRKAMSLSRW